MQRWNQVSGVPWTFCSIYPKNPESVCLTALYFSLTLLTLTGAIPDHFSLEKYNLVLQFSLLHIKGVSQIKPPLLIFQLAWQVYPDFFSYAYDCSVQFSHSVVCDSLRPHELSTPGLPVHHQLPDFTQTHVHRVCDAIQPSHPLSSPSPPALNLSQHQGLFK